MRKLTLRFGKSLGLMPVGVAMAVVALGSGAAHAVAPLAADGAAQSEQKESDLSIRSHTSHRIAGSYAGPSGYSVRFASHVTNPGAKASTQKLYTHTVKSVISVGGDRFSLKLTPGKQNTIRYNASSADATVSSKDKRALRTTATSLAKYLNAGKRTLTNEQALLVRSLSLFSDAPTGLTFQNRITKYTPVENSQNNSSKPPVETLANDNDGITFLSAQMAYGWTQHDNPNHGLNSYYVLAGPDSGIDRGRCGPAGSATQTGWTQDCLDHDFCSAMHESAGINCTDEFLEADEDTVGSLPCQCRNTVFDCGE